jgi:hypothetical protein
MKETHVSVSGGIIAAIAAIGAVMLMAVLIGSSSNTYNVRVFSPDMAANVDGDGFAVVCTGDCITSNNPAPTPAPAPAPDDTAQHRLNAAIMFIGLMVAGLALVILTLGGIL